MAEWARVRWMRWVIAAAVVFWGTHDAAAAGRRALLIGIGAYRNVRPLIAPPNDVAAMKKLLLGRWGFSESEIVTLIDEAATRRNILGTIEQFLIKGSRPGDTVVIYYSGHGSQVKDLDGDEEDGLDETLVPVDTGDGGAIETNQITDDEFGALLDRLVGRHVIVIVDACHSGTITRALQPAASGGAIPRTIFPKQASRGTFNAAAHKRAAAAHRREESFVRSSGDRMVWSAAAAHQYAWETGGQGLFTKFFIEGVGKGRADRNGNGIVTNAELLDFTRERAGKWCKSSAACKLGFTPTLEAPAAAMARNIVAVHQSGTSSAGGGTVQGTSGSGTTGGASQVTDVINQGNAAKIKLKILPSPSIRLGARVRFRVTSGRAGRLVLLDIRADNSVTQLFPNDITTRHGRDAAIRPGRPITVPDAYYGFEFTASKPVGKGTLLAIVIEDKLALGDILSQHGGLKPITNGADYLAQLAKRLRQIWHQDGNNRPVRWSLAEKEYRITK